VKESEGEVKGKKKEKIGKKIKLFELGEN